MEATHGGGIGGSLVGETTAAKGSSLGIGDRFLMSASNASLARAVARSNYRTTWNVFTKYIYK